MVTDAANVSPGFSAHKPYRRGAHVAVAIHSDPGFILSTEKLLEWQQERADQYDNRDVTCVPGYKECPLSNNFLVAITWATGILTTHMRGCPHVPNPTLCYFFSRFVLAHSSSLWLKNKSHPLNECAFTP